MKHNPIITSFAAGEFTPYLNGRPDLRSYGSGARTLLNGYIYPHGPFERRSGTRFVASVKDSSQATRIVAFQFSTTQAYILEFGHLYMRIYKDEGQVHAVAQNITGITKANPAVVTYSGSDTYSNGDRVIISGVVGMVEVNNREFTVANVNVGANTFELSGVNSSAYTAWASGGTIAEIIEVVTPYDYSDIFELQFCQNADNLFIFHNDYPPQQITRTSHTSWSITSMETSFFDGPYQAENQTATTLSSNTTVSAVQTTGVVITASSTTGINGGSGFLASDVGHYIRHKTHASYWGVYLITAFTSSTQVTVTVVGGSYCVAATPTTTWKMQAWSAYWGWPCCGTFFQDRFVLAGSKSFPSSFWLSQSGIGAYTNFQGALVDDTVHDNFSISKTIGGDKVSTIKWIKTQKVLLIGTSDSEQVVRATTVNEPLTPTNCFSYADTNKGSAALGAVNVDYSTIFITASGRKMMEMFYSFENDGFREKELSFAAEHILRRGGYVKDFCFAAEPFSNIFCALNTGTIGVLTFLKEQDVNAWARFVLGGVFGTGQAVVESVASISDPTTRTNQVWCEVKRTVNSATFRSIEFFEQPFTEDDAKEDMVFMDCCLTYDSTPATTISGLNHLIGETVQVLADGTYIGTKTVSASGTITLDTAASVVTVGLAYNTDIELLWMEGGGRWGTAIGKQSRIHRATVMVHNSLYFQIGQDSGHLKDVEFRKQSDPMSVSPPLFTGTKGPITIDSTFDDHRSLFIRQNKPYPLTVVAVMPESEVNDD